MTALRERMIEDLQLHGLSERTQQLYVLAVRQLAEYYHKSPDQIREEELRQYFLYLTNVKKVSPSTLTIAICAFKFLYEQTLQVQWTTFKLLRPPHENKLPVVLSIEEVRRILDCVNLLRFQVCLGTIYACGLRVQEAAHLQVKNIDSSRGMIHVCRGKGNKDRYVPLVEPTLGMLRRYWATHRNPVWLFPAHHKGKGTLSEAGPVDAHSIQNAFKDALNKSGVGKAATVHTLRHSWATHLLEAGVNLRVIQSYLGHASLETTALYTHLTSKTNEQASQEIKQILGDLWS
jgi:integrase/recombinase XerD